MSAFDRTLEKYGADLASRRLFDVDGPELLPYATLVSARHTGDPDLAAMIGVYEWQSTPLIFLVDGDQLGGDPRRLDRIRRLVGMRGDAPYVGVLAPGQLTVYRVSLDADPAERARIALEMLEGEERSTFALLANERPGVVTRKRQLISQVVLKLLSAAIDDLMRASKVAGNDAISLVGRALFTRFLGDRDLLARPLNLSEPSEIALLFDTPARAAATSIWLDETFNGDFLPLSAGLFDRLPRSAFATLGNILRRAPGGQLYLGWEEKWDNLDFAHIPVGVLSQAYEHYLHRHAPIKQRKEGGYYTPRLIAELMVRGAFHAFRRDDGAHRIRILDPAAGAGAFLITAFRQLVAERWRHDSKRPDTKTLREILYSQIVGFDINEAALRFAALGLYLMSIELDPNPEPLRKLRFENLRNTVLHKVGHDSGTDTRSSVGSLGSGVSESHLNSYDLVIGNPPWSSGTHLRDWPEVEATVKRIAEARNTGTSMKPALPNEVMDLPFVWRAMEWAKPGGQIVFALHARLLFLEGDGMPEARSALFSALDVTGVLNGTELRQTKVWPEISAPFCLLYARNQIPAPGAAFKFVSPRLESHLNNAGELRIDASNAADVSSEQVVRRPEILKIMFRGSELDLEVFDRLASRAFGTLNEYWGKLFGLYRGRPVATGNGYQSLRDSSRVRKDGDGRPGVSARYLADLPELTAEAAQSLLVEPGELSRFRSARIHDPRPRSLFLGPMLIVRESPPADTGRIQVSMSVGDVVFNQSYHGFSARNHPDGKRLIRYLALLISSKVAIWYALMISGRFGFEREVVEKLTIDRLPVPPLETMAPESIRQINPLFQAACRGTSDAWSRVDEWVATLYGLSERDVQIIADTLAFNLPFSANRAAAQDVPTSTQINDFCRTLKRELHPWAERAASKISVVPSYHPPGFPWRGLRIRFHSGSLVADDPLGGDWPAVLSIADQLAVSELIYLDPNDNSLWLGRLNQASYWSQSRARIVARRIVWGHLGQILG
jgi:hypothetical protein